MLVACVLSDVCKNNSVIPVESLSTKVDNDEPVCQAGTYNANTNECVDGSGYPIKFVAPLANAGIQCNSDPSKAQTNLPRANYTYQVGGEWLRQHFVICACCWG